VIYDDQSKHDEHSEMNPLNLDLLKTTQDILNKSTMETLFKQLTTPHAHHDPDYLKLTTKLDSILHFTTVHDTQSSMQASPHLAQDVDLYSKTI